MFERAFCQRCSKLGIGNIFRVPSRNKLLKVEVNTNNSMQPRTQTSFLIILFINIEENSKRSIAKYIEHTKTMHIGTHFNSFLFDIHSTFVKFRKGIMISVTLWMCQCMVIRQLPKIVQQLYRCISLKGQYKGFWEFCIDSMAQLYFLYFSFVGEVHTTSQILRK